MSRLRASVLVVDDNRDNLRLLQGILTNAGVEVRPAISGALALRAISARKPDLVLTDVLMPEMDGFEFCRRLKEREETAAIPVLFISALMDTDEKVKAFSVGGVDYITKPFSEQEVLARVRAHLQLDAAQRELRSMFEMSPAAILVADPDGRIVSANPKARALLDSLAEDLTGKWLLDVIEPEARADVGRQIEACASGRAVSVHAEARLAGSSSDESRWGSIHVFLARDANGEPYRLYATIQDISERVRTETRERALQAQLQQSQKLEAIGRLASGIAHEINTPAQFIGDNLDFLRRAIRPLLAAIDQHKSALEARAASDLPPCAAVFSASLKKAKYDIIAKDVPNALDEAIDGVKRIATIVMAMKEFAHPSGSERVAVDINRALETTSIVARNEWKYVATVEFALDPDLPKVDCYADELNQAFLNLIVNAAHAIGAKHRDDADVRGKITLSTRQVGADIEIGVTDDGCGIPPENREKIFEPFFTTKEVGKGTGQGLALVHAVVKKHEGTLRVESEVGKGTSFVMRIPLPDSSEADVASVRP